MQRAGLQRGVGVALWRQIADGIRSGLATGLVDDSGRLPPESELAERFGVNRHTVRAAISALAHEGVLHSVQGSGTFVRRRKRLVFPISNRTRFSSGLAGQARDRQTELLDHAREAASAQVAEALGLTIGDDVQRLETLGMADGMPVSRATSWFSAERFPTIAETYRETKSITAALALLGVGDYLRASTGVEARHADEADTNELQLSPGAIVIVTRALNVDPDGVPIQFSFTRFPADRVELMIETSRPTH
ncbi:MULTISPECIES: phosphonate metabolism transcriptional regulator PhnF [unclassified Beijerinckia]|uniref:phosphonate metabolism transcriptional regulator PhnF n=1 Tax=unclassified Beijerinckia TaxID=2638183 RepID=UPI000899C408|nr:MULTISPECIES: phosphonate metabolism transcriptional regulator PhnF [unclassified Beijerinckia]MDH7797129.1 GntR family phosphonate transport system transcriptional regulator [Beijerinckia sp. GAS462]SEC73395.1 GntR family transcriptional regulator, phosphonate transport system regulatory protein [Beijerinckia sp. 28-YEA-48]